MIAAPPRIRVAAYVIRPRPQPELLIFEHIDLPEAGQQVPAGGVNANEDLPTAVLREVTEETGVTGVTIVRALTTEDKPHPETGQPRRTTYFHLLAPTDTADDWIHRVEGIGSDTGMTFACHFHPLPLQHPLADDQDAWLGLIDPGLATHLPRTGRLAT
ncbi:DNA mismatch repair protein MutT [Amycolatopsis sp. WAC 01375]|uniref:NUDIX hydrolase n=1 Tax=Amycolatopsis sp. WAC 01375 TaxID=2203194 RepID=UPI000F768950|nr:NUDIX domain-containing protein [Amycolatopsis sp. WAC 01375]RSM72909.1 DNA mismatch repair protein MutT [Amycolatopsis sp. WAC 01375]